MLRFKLLITILIGYLLMVHCVYATPLVVVYPKAPEGLNVVYKQIIAGIKKQHDGEINLFEVPYKIKNDVAGQLARQVILHEPKIVICLGSSGRKIGRRLHNAIPWVSGAALIRPNDIAGITPIADPQVMFSSLKQLAPQVKRIYVVYSKRNQWLINIAEQAAAKANYEFFAFLVDDITSALSKYDELIKKEANRDDAIWLPIDKYSVETKQVVPMIIRKAWEKRFVVFSSQPEFVRRGVLFSFMPDNEVTGIELAKMVQSIYNGKMQAEVKTTSTIGLAVNLRTASHLGLEYSQQQKNQFLLTFPNR